MPGLPRPALGGEPAADEPEGKDGWACEAGLNPASDAVGHMGGLAPAPERADRPASTLLLGTAGSPATPAPAPGWRMACFGDVWLRWLAADGCDLASFFRRLRSALPAARYVSQTSGAVSARSCFSCASSLAVSLSSGLEL